MMIAELKSCLNNGTTTHYDGEYDGWIDLFGWSSVNNNWGISVSMDNNDYSGNFKDWDTTEIVNGGSDIDKWRTLSNEEWSYLFNVDGSTEGRNNEWIRYAKATVMGIEGILVFPDETTNMEGITNVNMPNIGFATNIVDATKWLDLESDGVVFLPVSGFRNGNIISMDYTRYRSSTVLDTTHAYACHFSKTDFVPTNYYYFYHGFSVRLVKDNE